MNIFPLSFGRKIPINQCQILDKQQNKYIEATVYEYDCKELHDVFEVSSLDATWTFKDLLTTSMHTKFMNNLIGRDNGAEHFYCIKDKKGEMLGLCQAQETENSIDVRLLVSKPDKKHKYIGQSMLSTLGEIVLKTGKEKLGAKTVLTDVRDFYEKKCGFKRCPKDSKKFGQDYEITREDIPKLIKETKRKTLIS